MGSFRGPRKDRKPIGHGGATGSPVADWFAVHNFEDKLGMPRGLATKFLAIACEAGY